MKSDKVDFAAEVKPRPIFPLAAATDLPVEKEETAPIGSGEKSSEFTYGEFP